MNTSNWINLGILLLTGIGVVVAVRQAAHARMSAREAKEHEQAALRAAVDSASAHRRSADALEEANALALAQHAPPKWLVTQVGRSKSTDKFRVDHHGPGVAYDVRIDVLDWPKGFVHTEGLPRETLAPGLAFSFSLMRLMGVPSDPTLILYWRDEPDGETRENRVTL